MTIAEARANAQSDPVPILTARWGEVTATARQRVAALTDSLRELERLSEQLGAHDLTIGTDLGAVGNAARAAFVSIEEHKVKHDHDFQLPKAS